MTKLEIVSEKKYPVGGKWEDKDQHAQLVAVATQLRTKNKAC